MINKNKPVEEILKMMQRSTDDSTAHPVFLAIKDRIAVSQSAYMAVEFCSEDDIDRIYMETDILLSDWYSETDGFRDDCDLADLFSEAGYAYILDDDGAGLTYWSLEDQIIVPEVRRVFWTREEANAYCEGGSCYSYGVVAEGALRKLMDSTCEREIERISARAEGRSSGL